MTADDEPPGEETKNVSNASYGPDLNAVSVGRVDWSPLSKFTGSRPYVSKYGVPRYSPLEWRTANEELVDNIPSAAVLDHETKNVIAQVSSACDKEQIENTLRLRQRAVEVHAKSVIVVQYCDELKEEVEKMAQYKLRLRKALEYLGIIEGINAECREIRKSRFEEDLVRDEVEEELFVEMDLCQQIRQLYMAALREFESQYKTNKGCYQEVHSIWSDQRETLDLETENIGLKSTSNHISFVQGNVRFEDNMSSLEIWENHMTAILKNIRDTIDSSQALRKRINSPILSESARDLKMQDEKVRRAFIKRIEEVTNERARMEDMLEYVLKQIAHAEGLYQALNTMGRQVDFNLKVAQTRLENRRHRPGVENCRDVPQAGLIHEVKVINERVTSLEVQMKKINDAIEELYEKRKKLERQIHVKRHSLSLDQERCMLFRSKFPNTAYILGY